MHNACVTLPANARAHCARPDATCARARGHVQGELWRLLSSACVHQELLPLALALLGLATVAPRVESLMG